MGNVESAVIDAVTQIANCLNRTRGYLTSIRRCDVATVLEAEALLIDEMERHYNGATSTNTPKTGGHQRALGNKTQAA